MSTKGKSWIAKKTCVKAFNAAVRMRRELIREALAFIHNGNIPLVVQTEERHILQRTNSNNGFVQDYLEELRDLDDIISRLSNFL